MPALFLPDKAEQRARERKGEVLTLTVGTTTGRDRAGSPDDSGRKTDLLCPGGQLTVQRSSPRGEGREGRRGVFAFSAVVEST